MTYNNLDPYAVPAKNEEELYRQIQQSGIQRIAKDSIT